MSNSHLSSRLVALLGGAGLALVLAAASPAAALDPAAVKAQVDKDVGADWPHLQALYEDIHSHPELGFQEERTAADLAKEMRAIGFTVTEHVGKTGLVAIYKNGPGPMVMARTELDALPMEEKTGLPYASRNKEVYDGAETFVAHSCGHDIHMTAWVEAAKALVAMKDKWHGTLMFIAQPSEEGVSGAKAMLADGLFQRFGKPDYGFAQHVGPSPAGELTFRAGIYNSNADTLDIRFIGRGGHGSDPAHAIDPVLIASRFVVDVQSVISREKDPAAFGVITVGAIQGGSAGNIIPADTILRGTIRSYDNDVRMKLWSGIERVAKAESEMAGAPPPEVTITRGAEAVINDAGLAARTGAVFKAAFGDKASEAKTPITASEDYSEFIMAGVPSLYYSIGGYTPEQYAAFKAKGQPVPFNHSPYFAPDPASSIKLGAEAMTLAVMSVAAK
ncbi:MAG: amidohydrolase [Alphaproteobacteria bacterium]|nr:amidohydrolase [Alphaproteobacteria bacterium]